MDGTSTRRNSSSLSVRPRAGTETDETGLARCWVLRARANACPPGRNPLDTSGARLVGPSDMDEPPRTVLNQHREAGTGRRWDRPYLENCTVDASIFDFYGQVNKSTWWMPWQ